MRVFEYKLVTNGDMSGDYISPVQQLTQMAICAIQATWDSAPVGVLNLQISNDNIIWTDYTCSSTDVNGAGNFLWNLVSIGFQYVRVQYVSTSGSGNLNVTVNGKGV